MRCPCCNESGYLYRAYMLYQWMRGVYCENCGEFIVDWPIWANWLFAWFVAPFAEFFPVAVSRERVEPEVGP